MSTVRLVFAGLAVGFCLTWLVLRVASGTYNPDPLMMVLVLAAFILGHFLLRRRPA